MISSVPSSVIRKIFYFTYAKRFRKYITFCIWNFVPSNQAFALRQEVQLGDVNRVTIILTHPFI